MYHLLAMRGLLQLALLLIAVSALEARKAKGKAAEVKQEEQQEEDGANDREGKLFSLFNTVKFQNNGCTSQSTISSSGTGSGFRNGTCYTSAECIAKGGAASGNCAAGFGVCCVFLVSTSGSTINQNCSYVRNPGFPSSFTGGTTGVSYTVKKNANNICSLRLDFESFTIRGTGNTVEMAPTATTPTTGGICLDQFTITTNTKQSIPVICGQNTGQHLYVEMGNMPTDTATLTFVFAGAASNRLWEIEVSQIPCYGASSRSYQAPPGCLQYHTGLTGRFTTFNFIPTMDNHLANQEYSVCIRQEKNFCCIQYTPCADINSFSLDTHGVVTTIPASPSAKSLTDSSCTGDYVGIAGSGGVCNPSGNKVPVVNKYCGLVLNPSPMNTANAAVCDCTVPFIVDIFTDSLTDTGTTANVGQSRGTCLTWTQIPCNS